ncbi:competence protein ComGA [Salirhabdus euzebyi]|uniref:Competence protein ComGA n=1 Tax=Salirhabdus euzebyi TaxID=394506 RepID=A0A841Q7A3_9BACI|nr:competence type IV pilus ATPase ComGA [Salirhabdus euzebyi]MBB6454255.1 competence protein ComGA [Salirhabdus euzebyi]
MSTVEQLSQKILNQAVNLSATDIHFSPQANDTDVFFRINGERSYQFSIPKIKYVPLLSFFKFTSGMEIGELQKPQNGTSTHHFQNNFFDLRLSTLPVEYSESLAIRILPRKIIPSIHHLFLFPKQATTLLNWIGQKFGIILITGPTGSGKTTTMYALLQALVKNKPFQAITLEDPIEKDLDNILQVQVNEKAGISYDAGLKAALRHDPDILMVGEIRDIPTAKFAFQAAFTGHLVITTIHAKNAFGTIYRLLDMGISKVDLEQAILGIASQQLLPVKGSRAAILELLESNCLMEAINGVSPENNIHFNSFQKLRRKACALGFIDENTYDKYSTQKS